MDVIRTTDWQALTQDDSGSCVSVYMATHPVGADGQQDPIRLRNLLDQAERQLQELGARPAEVRDLLRPARDLPDDPLFWQGRNKGLAVFVSPKTFRSFRLPEPFDELAVGQGRFHIKPLLPLLTMGQEYYLLALSQNHSRLFQGSRLGLSQVEVPGMPGNITDALNYTSVDRGEQVHSATRWRRGKQAAVFHGQGGVADSHKQDLANFLRLVHDAVQAVLGNQPVPLLLAGVDYLLPIFREVNAMPQLLDVEVLGNCDYRTPTELHQKTWPVMKAAFAEPRIEAVARYERLCGTTKVSDAIEQIVPAACDGRVDVLFVDKRRHAWGIYDRDAGEVKIHSSREAGDEDLLDFAAARTLASGGTVHAVDHEHVPGQKATAAIYRYG